MLCTPNYMYPTPLSQVIQMDLEIQIFPYFRSVGEGEVGEGMCVCVWEIFCQMFQKKGDKRGEGGVAFLLFCTNFYCILSI